MQFCNIVGLVGNDNSGNPLFAYLERQASGRNHHPDPKGGDHHKCHGNPGQSSIGEMFLYSVIHT